MRSGYTFLELVIVIALIGTLTTTMFGSFSTSFNNIGSSSDMSRMATAIDQMKSLAYSAFSIDDPGVAHNFNLYIDDEKLEIYENLDGDYKFNAESDRMLFNLDFTDPANSLKTDTATFDDQQQHTYNVGEPIVFGFKEGALDCDSNIENALSIELENVKNELVVGYLYINPDSCHLEITTNNLHD
jgi:prepilin-type N-terminal cleavage/methylation domain-containing protein